MTGKDLMNYIVAHNLEDAEVDIGISDPLQFVVKISGDTVSEERELVYDFTRDFVYEKYLAVEQISYDEASKRRNLDIDKAWKKWQEDLARKFIAMEEEHLKKKIEEGVITNRDKFKEVFGFEPDVAKGEAMCDLMCCYDKPCAECRYLYHPTWENKYEDNNG